MEETTIPSIDAKLLPLPDLTRLDYKDGEARLVRPTTPFPERMVNNVGAIEYALSVVTRRYIEAIAATAAAALASEEAERVYLLEKQAIIRDFDPKDLGSNEAQRNATIEEKVAAKAEAKRDAARVYRVAMATQTQEEVTFRMWRVMADLKIAEIQADAKGLLPGAEA